MFICFTFSSCCFVSLEKECNKIINYCKYKSTKCEKLFLKVVIWMWIFIDVKWSNQAHFGTHTHIKIQFYFSILFIILFLGWDFFGKFFKNFKFISPFFILQGKALCMLTEDMFKQRVPNSGDILYRALKNLLPKQQQQQLGKPWIVEYIIELLLFFFLFLVRSKIGQYI